MVGVAPDAEQVCARRAAGKQVGALDEAEAWVAGETPGQDRGDGEEELVDETCREERRDRVRAAFRQDQPVAAAPERRR